MIAEGEQYDDEVQPRSGARVPPSGFGRYHVFARLGPHPLADVFLAIARGPMGFDRLTVIKRLRPRGAGEPSFRESALDEARLAARLNHPNVIPSYEVGESHGSFYVAMEYLEGQPLDAVIAAASEHGAPLDPAFCARVIADACGGLAHAHELRDYDGTPLPVFHRDLSARALLVTYDGRVMLGDFGIARAARSSTDSQSWKIAATSGYVAHEQAMGGALDDLFALGMVLWEMLAGRPLTMEAGEPASRHRGRAAGARVSSIAVAVPGIDPRMEAIVRCALEKDPQRRFATARAMREALEQYIEESRKGRPPAAGEPARAAPRALSSADVGGRVTALFAEEREAVRRRVQRQVDAMRASSPPSSGAVRGLSLASLDRIESAGGDVSVDLLDLGEPSTDACDPVEAAASSPPAVPASSPSRPRAHRRALWLLVPLAVAVGVTLNAAR